MSLEDGGAWIDALRSWWPDLKRFPPTRSLFGARVLTHIILRILNWNRLFSEYCRHSDFRILSVFATPFSGEARGRHAFRGSNFQFWEYSRLTVLDNAQFGFVRALLFCVLFFKMSMKFMKTGRSALALVLLKIFSLFGSVFNVHCQWYFSNFIFRCSCFSNCLLTSASWPLSLYITAPQRECSVLGLNTTSAGLFFLFSILLSESKHSPLTRYLYILQFFVSKDIYSNYKYSHVFSYYFHLLFFLFFCNDVNLSSVVKCSYCETRCLTSNLTVSV
jgi:hypothetical protein